MEKHMIVMMMKQTEFIRMMGRLSMGKIIIINSETDELETEDTYSDEINDCLDRCKLKVEA